MPPHDEMGENEESIADSDLGLLHSGRHRQPVQMKGVCGMYSRVEPLFYFYSFICFRQHRDWDNINGIGYFLKVLFPSICPLNFTANVSNSDTINDVPEVLGGSQVWGVGKPLSCRNSWYTPLPRGRVFSCRALWQIPDAMLWTSSRAMSHTWEP